MFLCTCYIFRRSNSPCSRLWLCLRDRVPVETSGRVPLSSAHGPAWPVPAKGAHPLHQVSGGGKIISFILFSPILFYLFFLIFICSSFIPSLSPSSIFLSTVHKSTVSFSIDLLQTISIVVRRRSELISSSSSARLVAAGTCCVVVAAWTLSWHWTKPLIVRPSFLLIILFLLFLEPPCYPSIILMFSSWTIFTFFFPSFPLLSGKSPKSWWTCSTRIGRRYVTRGHKSSWSQTSSATWRIFRSSHTDLAVRPLSPPSPPSR